MYLDILTKIQRIIGNFIGPEQISRFQLLSSVAFSVTAKSVSQFAMHQRKLFERQTRLPLTKAV